VNQRWAYSTRTVRVLFGEGTIGSVPHELERLDFARPYLIATPGREREIQSLKQLLGRAVAGSFMDAKVHVPAEVVSRAKAAIGSGNVDVLIAVGGGSAIGLAKALSRELSLPIVAIPTTYSGSEMTEVWGTTEGDEKRTGRDPGVAPRLVIYEPALTVSLPPRESAASGMNAIAHAVESLYAADRTPYSDLLAVEGLRLLAASLPRVVDHPEDLDARSQALLGAHFAGQALQQTTMGLHHKLCHALGGIGLPHALTHAILLPYTAAFVTPLSPRAMATVASALGATDAATGLHALKQRLGIAERLRDVGLREDQIDRVAPKTLPGPTEPVNHADLVGILKAAY